MINLQRLTAWLFPDRRPDWEKARERNFITAVNKLRTLSVSARGGLSLDPEELREQVLASRERLKHLVHKPSTPSRPVIAVADTQVGQEATPHAEASADSLECIEVVAWRRLSGGAAVRYVCLQSAVTGRFAVATANLFSGDTESLPPWIDANVNRQAANAIRSSEFHWFTTVSEAMAAWDPEL